MKRLICLLFCLAFTVSLTACRENEPKTMYIEPAKLTEDEENIAELLGANAQNWIYDFRLDDSVKSMQINTYELVDGAWKVLSGGGGQQFIDREGRIALGFEDIADGMRVAIQSEHNSGATSYIRENEKNFNGMATAVLGERKEIVFEQEIPLAVQIHTSQNEIHSYTVDYYFEPEEYEKYGYEQVYAVTVLFTQKTVGELTSQ